MTHISKADADDLKPCPFCGSDDLSPALSSKRYIECSACGCFGPSVQNQRGLAGSFVQWEIVHASINDAWNSRAHKTTEAAEAATAAPVASDKARLDFGCIVIHSRDEFGEPQAVEHRGIDLRAAIDAAIRMELRHP